MNAAHTHDVQHGDTHADAARLRAESDAFQAHLGQLAELEDRKRALSPSEPEFIALAVEVEQLAAIVLADARGQTELGDRAHRDGVTTPIIEVPDDLTAQQILVEWRAAERQLVAADPASDEAREMRATVDAYRRAYQVVFEKSRGTSTS
jgi:hypothetical protein